MYLTLVLHGVSIQPGVLITHQSINQTINLREAFLTKRGDTVDVVVKPLLFVVVNIMFNLRWAPLCLGTSSSTLKL